jgi:hypothetical protein
VKFYKYWAPAEAKFQNSSQPWPLRAYGGSDVSLEDAKQRAREVAERAAAAIEQRRPLDSYGYERPLREEIVEEMHSGGEVTAVITRNAFGSLVLNTGRVLFADVDFPFPTGEIDLGKVLTRLWNRLTGKPAAAGARDDEYLERFQRVLQERPGMGARVYRTFCGFRLLVTSGEFDPASSATNQLLAALGSDPLYIRLCQAQECFRARLSAKHWRCGVRRPPLRYPWASDAEEARYRQWEQEYHRHANQFATCALVASLGAPPIHAAVLPIVETHDRLAIKDGAPLA